MKNFQEHTDNVIKFTEKGDFGNALYYCGEALENAYSIEERALAYWNRAIVYSKMGKSVDAIYDLGEVLSCDPSHYNARKTLQNIIEDPSTKHSLRDMAINQLRRGN